MILKNYYYYYPSVIPEYLCDDIIRFANNQQELIASTGGRNTKELQVNKELQKENEQHRSSHISWLEEPWIYNEIQPYVHEANKLAGWNFDWDFSETIQFTKYKLNQYYHWHADQEAEPYNNGHPQHEGKIRKLSCTIQLNHPHEYEGGDLQFHTPHGEFTCNEIKKECYAFNNSGQKNFFDYSHYTKSGAKFFGKKIHDIGWLDIINPNNNLNIN